VQAGGSRRNPDEGEPKGGSQASIQPLFDIFQATSVIRPSEWISSKPNINHTKMIYEPSKRAIGRARDRSAPNFFRLIHHRVEVTNAKPRGFKAIPNSCKGIPKNHSITSFRRTIDTREDPWRIGGSE
jgi:hypothetical protein